MTATLDDILQDTRRRVSALRRRRAELEAAVRSAPPAAAWMAAFGPHRVSVIAEVKRRSPSAGAIAPDLDAAGLAAAYERGGAAAVSVLTEPAHFGGSISDLEAVRASVGVPVLRKDFIVDPLQLQEARARGASAVLLIVRALGVGQLGELAAAAEELGLGRLVEVHDRRELERALAIGVETVGVNSRDLVTFALDAEGMRDVLQAIPPGTIAIAESGLSSREDVERVADWGADAVLVGTALAGAADPEAAVRRLVGVRRSGRRR